jgi:exopolysaccharide production protein ExoQ
VKGIFLPTFWYMVVASRPPGVWLVTWGFPVGTGSDPTEGSSVDRYFFLALTIIGLFVLARRGFRWGETFRRNPWITALVVFMGISILWSQYPFVSFKRYIKVVGSIVMAFVILSNERSLDAVFAMLRHCFYIHLPMSFVCVKYFRDIGVSFDWGGGVSFWNGIATSKNTLGQVVMLAVLYFFWEVRKSWPKQKWRNIHVVYLLMGLYLLKGSEDSISMTSVFVCVFAMIVFWGIQSLRTQVVVARKFVTTIFSLTLGLVVLIQIHSVVKFSPDSIFGMIISAFGRDVTLTDRTFIWDDVYAASSNPLFGIGFGGFWIGKIANIPWNANMTWVLGQAHSGYVDTYLQLGLVGDFLLAGTIFFAMALLKRSLDRDFDLSAFRITLLLTIAFINITESIYLRGDHHLWLLLMVAVWIVPKTRRASKRMGEPRTARTANEEPVREATVLS